MFTGLIEETGTVQGLRLSGNSAQIRIGAAFAGELAIGESVAVNGVCLSVTHCDRDGFTADMMPVTLRESVLGSLRKGDKVNLERALKLGDRLGGHIVSGHIDGTGRITAIERNQNAVLISVAAEEKILDLMVNKGSVAIDGISLTIAELLDNKFIVSIVPHTYSFTCIRLKRVGDFVNIETDIIGKYLRRLTTGSQQDSCLCEEFLKINGF